MNILVAFNDGYAIPTKVMLKSLICNNPGKIDVYVLYCELSDSNITSLKELTDDNVTLHFTCIESAAFDQFPLTHHFSKEAYIRLFAHEYIDESVDRILWLDGDIIVNGPIDELYNQDFDDKCYVAMRDMGAWNNPIFHSRIGLSEDKPYINSGVLLMNLQEIRRQISRSDILDYIQNNFDKLEFVDQDVLNGLLYNKIKVLNEEERYNCFSKCISPFNERKVIHNVRIIHYVSQAKPWKEGYPFGAFDLWWKYSFMVSDTVYNSNYKSIKKSHKKAVHLHQATSVIKSICPNISKSRLYQKLKKEHIKSIDK